ncbi:MAG: hypothetical protein FJW68_00065 [Actinobacteria bacterium]|nr:hypothetical protein [Actinomycetota bacterium]
MEYEIDAKDMHYRILNSALKEIIKNAAPVKYADAAKSQNLQAVNNKIYGQPQEKDGPLTISLKNVIGQRYIGDGIKGNFKIKIYGVPGNDMAAFMDGPQIEVFGNAQDGLANTMNSGKIIVHGSSGDITGYSMRGGEIYIRDNVGWRSGIHMKSYLDKFPVIVIGGRAGNFLGEYMAGGLIIVLGQQGSAGSGPEDLGEDKNIEDTGGKKFEKTYYFEKFYSTSSSSVVGDFAGTGMHGGKIFICGDVDEYKIGKEVKKAEPDKNDIEVLKQYINNYCSFFKADYEKMISGRLKNFVKLSPHSHRPYGKLYAY